MLGSFINYDYKQNLFYYKSIERNNNGKRWFQVSPVGVNPPPWKEGEWRSAGNNRLEGSYTYANGAVDKTEGLQWKTMIIWSDYSLTQNVEDFDNVNQIAAGLLEFKRDMFERPDEFNKISLVAGLKSITASKILKPGGALEQAERYLASRGGI